MVIGAQLLKRRPLLPIPIYVLALVFADWAPVGWGPSRRKLYTTRCTSMAWHYRLSSAALSIPDGAGNTPIPTQSTRKAAIDAPTTPILPLNSAVRRDLC